MGEKLATGVSGPKRDYGPLSRVKAVLCVPLSGSQFSGQLAR